MANNQEAGIASSEAKQGSVHLTASAEQTVPAGYVLVPDWKGYALLGTGRYRIDHSAPPMDPELGAELVISLAKPEDIESGRKVGEERASDGLPIQPEEMVIRIGFLSVEALDALENQLRHLRADHFPEGMDCEQPKDADLGSSLLNARTTDGPEPFVLPEDVDYNSTPCPKCRAPETLTRTCWNCGGEGGFDAYEDDPLWNNPGDIDQCDACFGHGVMHWCGRCGHDFLDPRNGQVAPTSPNEKEGV